MTGVQTCALPILQFGVQDLINRRNAELTATVAERTNNLMLIKSMSAEAKEAAAGGERMKASYRAAGMNIWITGTAIPIRAIASVLKTIVIILVGRGYYASGAKSLLSIKPVVGVVDGKVVVLGKARGSKASRSMVFEEIEKAGGIDFTRPVWVAYSGLSDKIGRKYIADSLAIAADEGIIERSEERRVGKECGS